MQALYIYLLIVNAASLLVMTADKLSARKNLPRIPERTLFLLALIGGSGGAWAGMYTFRHKTRHWYFVWGIPAILLAQVALAVWLTVQK